MQPILSHSGDWIGNQQQEINDHCFPMYRSDVPMHYLGKKSASISIRSRVRLDSTASRRIGSFVVITGLWFIFDVFRRKNRNELVDGRVTERIGANMSENHVIRLKGNWFRLIRAWFISQI